MPNKINLVLIAGGIAVASFLIGFASMWMTSKGYENDRDNLAEKLRPSVMQNSLATAAINSRNGEFEGARKQASQFFTELRSELQREQSAFEPGQRNEMDSILSERDETITLLARNDPAGAERLSELYFKFVHAKNSPHTESK